MDDKYILATLDQITASNLVLGAQVDNLLTLVEFLSERMGVKDVEGLPVRDWFDKEKGEQIERILIHLEDKNPTVAAFLQQTIDNSCKESDPPRTND